MSDSARTGDLPRLAYVYHPLSFAPLAIAAAARDICSLVWIVDSTAPDVTTIGRLLSKFGQVVDRAGATVDEVAADLRIINPDGVVSLHDADLVWTAQLAERLGLPFHSVDAANKMTDKHAQRAALANAGLAVPPSAILAADADASEVIAGFRYPAVLKPRWGQASRDTLPVASASEVERLLADVRSRPDAASEDYVLEGFIPDATQPLGGEGFADMVSVESVIEAGRVAHAGISSRTPFRWPFRETGFCTPTAIVPELQSELYRVAGAAAQAVGAEIGCLHTEIKLTDDGPVVIEVNGRPGGGKSEMLERASGFSILESALRLAVGEPVGLTGPVHCRRVAYQLYIFPEEEFEFIDEVEGMERLKEIEGLEEAELRRGPGQRIDWREGSQAHVFNCAGTVPDIEALRALMVEIPSLVTITGHNGPTHDA